MKSISSMEARNVNGGAWWGKVSAKCSACGKTFYRRWWFTQSSWNTAYVLVNSDARNCAYYDILYGLV